MINERIPKSCMNVAIDRRVKKTNKDCATVEEHVDFLLLLILIASIITNAFSLQISDNPVFFVGVRRGGNYKTLTASQGCVFPSVTAAEP